MVILERKTMGILTFIIGGLIGAAVGILYAPRSGKETRKIMTEEAQDVMDTAISSIRDAQDAALSAIKDSRSQLEKLSEETKDRLAKLQDIMERTVEDQKKSLKKGYSNARAVVKD